MVDLLGADKNQNELFKGIVDALNTIKDLFIYACAKKDDLEIDKYEFDHSRLEIIDSSDSMSNYDSPTKAFFSKE